MSKSLIAVRDVDEETFRRFRARAVEEGVKLGDTLTLAMRRWLEEGRETAVPNPKNLLKLSGVVKTKQKVKWSEEVDGILYGK